MEVHSRVAAARRKVIQSAVARGDPAAEEVAMLQPTSLAAKSADQPTDDILFVSEQVQRELVEIDRASAILRNAQPDLEAWPNQTVEVAPTPKPRPVWFVIGAVWISTVLLTAIATLAIAALVS